MKDDNTMNVVYFENATMRGLYQDIISWQEANQKRMLSLEIAKDGDLFCCIGLTNPSEVIICSGIGSDRSKISRGRLLVSS